MYCGIVGVNFDIFFFFNLVMSDATHLTLEHVGCLELVSDQGWAKL